MASENNGIMMINGQNSLLVTLNKYVAAVNNMNSRIMIPSRLRDMEVTTETRPEISEENNNMALLPTVAPGTDLYNCYIMLNAIRAELINGESRIRADIEFEEETADAARKTAAAFTYHLRGLFNVLHKLTETANYLGNKYESDVGSSSGASLSSFAI
ncbi:hypothetical protein CHS0354_023359 [Potamilus streckersoni]|uniref:Uncharacterized protein n=1 Tax=Potamilus streckersoni TaxID=2493646 RepID=A0AAE0T528_9BIVA|nr:hypothetical protein CHS0354_023359 [Potamilus streckersoni]